jgi:phage terminase small subunit
MVSSVVDGVRVNWPLGVTIVAKLNDRQLKFAHEYVLDFCATRAAKRAGYSAKTSRQIGSRLLQHVDIQRVIKRLYDRRRDAVGLTAQEVVEQVAKLAFADVRELVGDDGELRPLHELSDDAAASIASFELSTVDGERRLSKVKTTDKIRSLELLAKHLGILPEQHQHIHGHVITFSPDVIATMTESQLERLETAQTTIVQLQAELTTGPSSASVSGRTSRKIQQTGAK